MQSIAFDREGYYLRKGVQKIEIDETKVNFINGYGIVEAKVLCFEIESSFGTYKPKMYIYFCEGLINENFEEAFPDKNKSSINQYFSFREENKRIMRFGENNFIVETIQKNQGFSESSYTHIKIDNNKPTILKENIKDFSLTSLNNIVIINGQFYYVPSSKTIGPKFLILKEDPNRPGEFIVVDKIVAPEENNTPISYPNIDVLTYRMNKDFQLISFPHSFMEEGPVYFKSTDCNQIRKEREMQLLEKRAKFKELVESLENTYSLK